MARPPKRPHEDPAFEDPFNVPAETVLEGQLTADDLARVEKEAKEAVDAELKSKALKRAKEQALIRHKVAAGLLPRTDDEGTTRVRIDVAKFAPAIFLDQRVYWHGYTYEVPVGTARTLLDIMHRSHGHQAEIEGRSRFEAAQRPRAVLLGKRPGITTSQSLRG